jgi:hypothetical protein
MSRARNRGYLLALAGAAALAAVSCNGGSGITADRQITTVLFGRATDRLGTPLEGVKVQLLGDQVYEALTDELGYYRIGDVFVAHAEAIISTGAAGGMIQDATGIISTPVSAQYTILFSHQPKDSDQAPALATFRDQVTLSATVYRTGNSYTYETFPVSYDALLVPYAEFRVRVVTGAADGNGAPVPAAGATVEVWPNAGEALKYETAAARLTTDPAGYAVYDASYRLPAVNGYRVVVLPFDVNPAAADGYEFDTVWVDLDLSAWSELLSVPNQGYQLAEVLINLSDLAATNAGPMVAFSSPPDGGEIAPNAPIRLQLSRAMDPGSLEHVLRGCYRQCGQPDDQVLLTRELERSSFVLSLAAADDLSRLFFNFELTVTGRTVDGAPLSAVLHFRLAKASMPENPSVPSPTLFLPLVDGSTSQHYYSVVDFSGAYVFDSVALDEPSYRGALYATTNATVGPDLARPRVELGLPLQWRPITGAEGYRVYVRTAQALTSWVLAAELGPSALQLLDSGLVTASISLPAGADVYGDDAVLTPFCCGNALMVAVLPLWGGVTPPIDPNAILVLSDNYGPAIMPPSQGANFDGQRTEISSTGYDQLVTIAFSEYLDPTQQPTILSSPASESGVLKASGRFGIEWVDWVNTSHHTAWHVQLRAPPALGPSDLYVGDTLRTTTGGTCVVTGLDLCTSGQPRVYCDGQLFQGATFELVGPMRGPGAAARAITVPPIPATIFSIGDVPDNATFATAHPWMMEQGSTRYVVRGGTVYEDTHLATLPQAVRQGFTFDGTTVLNNTPMRRLAAAVQVIVVGQPADLALDSVQGLAIGDRVTLVDTSSEAVVITAVDTLAQRITVSSLTFGHAAGTQVALAPNATLESATLAGVTTIRLADPNAAAPFGFAPGDQITVGSGATLERAIVVAVNGRDLSLTTDPVYPPNIAGLTSAHDAFSPVRLAQGTIIVRGAQLDLEETDGMKPGVPLTVVRTDSTVLTFGICGVQGDALLLDGSEGLWRIQSNDAVVPFATQQVRPEDRLQVVARDAAGNPMRSVGRVLSGDGVVQ